MILVFLSLLFFSLMLALTGHPEVSLVAFFAAIISLMEKKEL